MLAEQAAKDLQSAARVQGLFNAAEALEGAAGELSTAVEEFGAITRGLGILIGGFLATFDNVNTALGEGTLAIADPRTQMKALAAPDITKPMPVEIVNPDDIYDPARIEELRGEGLNNREIGMALRAAADPIKTDIPMLEPVSTIEPTIPDSGCTQRTPSSRWWGSR